MAIENSSLVSSTNSSPTLAVPASGENTTKTTHTATPSLTKIALGTGAPRSCRRRSNGLGSCPAYSRAIDLKQCTEFQQQ